MLDTDTKRRIDTARDILVGKVPDPKSQVEQITIALIYKFMDDMDAEAEELGGKRKFFTGDFARYGWAKLMSAGIGGHELIGLYGEGISTMPQNPGIPALFRDIFKNAYLPYRDPETLKSFLKIIDEFSYDHSERLGDAFEYLLSVLGSQGDAGQFRTPRHIIDFIVEVIAPKKGDVILDPACGTAGFLISAYKHILATNSDAKNANTLTPDEKGRLAKNFQGYDISPDMVRLSLVNLYLHGFTDPHIFEYDTLTSEERWNEYADVILANPPFMSPKGGIKPHKRFSIQAKRSEVLFVDYIAEHLTPTGRAGIIVPEGIIFQSQTAYKELRKMLVENSLVAVISLPAGVFQPYSGVKTSILILDKLLAKQCDTIAFFKVENDGFGLGAQRRANAGEQLTQVQFELEEYLHALRSGQSAGDLVPTLGLIVAKEKIAANGDYNLSGDRYRENSAGGNTGFPMVPLGDLCDVRDGTHDSPKYVTDGYPLITSKNLKNGYIDFSDVNLISREDLDAINKRSKVDEGDILMPMIGTIGNPVFADPSREYAVKNVALIKFYKDSKVVNRFVKEILASAEMQNQFNLQSSGSTQKFIPLGFIRSLPIPLPSLEVQKEIVAEIEGYQKVINGARAVLDNYRPHIPIHPDWPMVELGSIVEDMHQGINTAGLKIEFVDKGIPIIQSRNITSGILDFKNIKYMSADDWETYREKYKPKINDVLFTNIGTIGKSIVVLKDEDYLIHWNIFIIKTGNSLNHKYLKTYLDYLDGNQYFSNMQRGGTVQFVSKKQLSETPIALPPIEIQQTIVDEIEAEQALVNANRELILRFENKIQATLARVWGEEEKPVVET